MNPHIGIIDFQFLLPGDLVFDPTQPSIKPDRAFMQQRSEQDSQRVGQNFDLYCVYQVKLECSNDPTT